MDKATLIKHLNDDLANEFAAIIQYSTYAAKVTGPYRPQLVQFFSAELPDEQAHAQFLANKIVTLGGEPVTVAAPVKAASTTREMLEAVLEAESRAIAGYTQRASEADALGDIGLRVQLENMILDETTHRDETARILANWSL